MSILITGGASGLGKAITKRLAAECENDLVFFTYYRSCQSAKEIEYTFSNAKAIKCNFSDKEEMEKLKSLMSENEIRVLINNAISVFSKDYFHKTDLLEFNESFGQNVMPTIAITQNFIKQARKRKEGKIITILSSVVENPAIGWSKYLAEKMYLLGLSKCWAKENIQFNISANCVSPGFMRTRLQHDLDERVIDDMLKKHPLKKILTIEEVADVVLFLVKSTAQLNGQNIIIDPV